MALGVAVFELDSRYAGVRTAYGGVIFLLSGVMAVALNKRGRIFFFSPLAWVLSGIMLFFCLSPILQPRNSSLYSSSAAYFPLILVVTIGVSAYCAGFWLAPVGKNRTLEAWLAKSICPEKLARILLGIFVLYGLLTVFLARAQGIDLGTFATQSQYLFGGKAGIRDALPGWSYYAFFVYRLLPVSVATPTAFCLFNKQISRLLRYPLILGIAVMTVITVSGGSRGILAAVLVSMGIFFVLAPDRQPLRGLGRVVLALCMTGVVALSAVQITARTVEELSWVDLIGLVNPSKALADDFLSVDADQNITLHAVLTAERNGTIQHLWGESYALAFVALIPRAVWSSKPGGAEMYNKLAVLDPWLENYNITHSVFGELLYNFGYLGLVPGMGLFGVCAGWWWGLLLRNRFNNKMIILYSMSLIPVALLVRGSFHAMFGLWLYSTIITVLALAASSSGPRNYSIQNRLGRSVLLGGAARK